MTKVLFLLAWLPLFVFAGDELAAPLDLTNHWVGYAALALFVLAYILVMVEEFTHFRKSKPVILVAGVIWGLIGWVYASNGCLILLKLHYDTIYWNIQSCFYFC